MCAQLLEGVAAAQEALGLLVGAGDLTGALDVLADLRGAAAPAAAAGLAALRPLPQQLAAAGAVTLPCFLSLQWLKHGMMWCSVQGSGSRLQSASSMCMCPSSREATACPRAVSGML